VAAATAVGTAASIAPAGADQLANERAEAQTLADKINALGLQEGALGEQYNAGVIALAQANGRVVLATKQMHAAESDQQKTLALLRQDAVEAYVGGGADQALTTPGPLKTIDDALLRQELEQTVASDQSDILDSYRLAEAQASTARAELVVARNDKAHQVAGLQHDRDQVQAAEYQLEGLEAQVKGRIATLVAQIEHEQMVAEEKAEAARLAQERAEAAAAAQAQATAEAQAAVEAAAERQQEAQQAAEVAAATKEDASEDPAVTVPATTVPPVTVTTTPSASVGAALPGENPAAPGAIAAAESRLGDAYVWGGAGPDVFDCSGLVMWSYDQVGISLPHYSGSQYADTIHIPMSDLEPGDLVFPGGLFHVAMYIGNGEIIQAPYTGAYVQIVPLTNFFTLASRVG
jgi:peptidoglycan DL-endopeptidase CwlO